MFRFNISIGIGLLFILPVITSAQQAVISGMVTDAASGESLVGVNVTWDSLAGVATGEDGHYRIITSPGVKSLTFRFIGYHPETHRLNLQPGATVVINVRLVMQQFELNQAVITASKFEQKLSDVPVSMEIIRARFIENTNTVNMESAISKIPGVDVLDGQASIRGGSGYSFGAGSRVMVLVDDLPILTADVNEVKWSFLPVEQVERVEILKGASSALYGSSALNGVINLLTAWPGDVPATTVELYSGVFMKPRTPEMAWWWDGLPLFGGGSFTTLQKLGRVDLVVGANGFTNQGYREENYENRIRSNFKLRHRPEKIRGLSYGMNGNVQWQNTSDFLIWQDADSGAFLQRPDAITPTRGMRFNLDPWILYFDSNQNRHSLRMRFYQTYNRFEDDPDKDNGSDMYYGEYQFQQTFREKLNLTAGITAMQGITNAELYGDHKNLNLALFTQIDYIFSSKLSATVGFRWEHYSLDQSDSESSPVMRAGLTYKPAEYTSLRASFGQGYRFPSIAEKYTSTQVGSLNIFPNPQLESEQGWSAEIGSRQGFRFGRWEGFIDLAGYWTEYRNMIEFIFGVWVPDSSQVPTLDDIGFKSLNVGKARINGIDLNIAGSGKLRSVNTQFFAGYTYMNPVDLTIDTTEDNILKYRYKHSVKGDIEGSFRKWATGLTYTYNSFMERVDEAFEETILGQQIFPGLKAYREEHDHGFFLLDWRVSCQITRAFRLSLLIKNILNTEYMGRPGDIRPPRNATLQALIKF